MRKKSRTVQFFPNNMCESTYSDRSIVKKFSRKWNNLPIENWKEKLKNKFKEKLTRELLKLHERVPIDGEVQDFGNYFY